MPDVANKHSGYIVGGSRGFLIGPDPTDAAAVLAPTLVSVGYRR